VGGARPDYKSDLAPFGILEGGIPAGPASLVEARTARVWGESDIIIYWARVRAKDDLLEFGG